MGYITTYSLRIKNDANDNELTEEMAQKLMEIEPDYFPNIDCITDLEDASLYCKWYDHEQDMLELSKSFPETLFILEGDGEESEDIWIKYFQAGKMQVAYGIITFEEFNPDKLK